MNAKVRLMILVSIALVVGISGQVFGQGNGSKSGKNKSSVARKSGEPGRVMRNSHGRYAKISYAKGGGEVSMEELHFKRKVKSGQKHSQRLATPNAN